MTTGNPRSDEHEGAAKKTREGTPLGRIRDWFWRTSALAEVRAAMPEPGERSVVFAQRARASAEIAHNMLEPAEAAEISAEGSACESYRQAIYWAQCALLARADPAFRPDDSELVWGSLDEAVVAAAASSEARVDGLQRALRSGSFVYFAELPAAEQSALLAELRKVTRTLQAKLAERSVALDAVYLQRAWRLGLLALLALCVALSPAVVKKVLEARSDLSSGKPWRASSKFGDGGCASPAQQCPESAGFFFHTNEEANPWVEFDLGSEKKVSKVRVDNRSDCCSDRADPIVIELGTDQKHWRRVARHDGEFTSWEATFSPASTRYVRVRLLKTNYLHLAGVHIY